MTTISDAVWQAVGDRARPLLTYYGRGQRVGLSGATLENWAAKIANYLRDEAGLFPGDAVIVDLDEHWQSAATLLGAWWAGLRVDLDGSDSNARVAFTTIDRVDNYPNADELIVVPLDSFGGRVPGLPLYANDFGDTVRPHGDHFSPGGTGAEALGSLSIDEVLERARAQATTDGIAAGNRVLSDRPWRTADDLVNNFLAPLIAGAALVWADPVDGHDLSAIAATEHTDLTLG